MNKSMTLISDKGEALRPFATSQRADGSKVWDVTTLKCAANFYWCFVFPLMLQGEEGVREVLQILNDEFRLSMALSGKTWDAKIMFNPNPNPKKTICTALPKQICSYLNQAAGTWRR